MAACGGAPVDEVETASQAVLFEEGGVKIEVDEDGFITDPSQWSEDVATALAGGEGIDELGRTHWAYVDPIRKYYLRYRVAPSTKYLYATTGITAISAAKLFPSGALGACKVAGLPAKLCYAAYVPTYVPIFKL